MGSFHFKVENASTGECREFERSMFSPELKERIVAFCGYAETLNNCSFVKNWSQIQISIKLAKDGRIENNGVLPPEDDIAAFLHRLRPFFLKRDEPTNFHLMITHVSRHLADPTIDEIARHWRSYYDGRESQNIFTISVGGKVLNSDEFFNNYIYAFEYHRNKEKRKIVDDIAQHFPLEAQRPLFILLLMTRLNAINTFASFLKTCLDGEDGKLLTIAT